MSWNEPQDVPPAEDFPYLVVAARRHKAPARRLCRGYYVPRHAVVHVEGDSVRLSGTLADSLDNLGWNARHGFLP